MIGQECLYNGVFTNLGRLVDNRGFYNSSKNLFDDIFE